MLGLTFKQANVVLTTPIEMENCLDLPVFVGQYENGDRCIISCWQPNREDIEAIMRGEPIWVSILGVTQPPIMVCTENPFVGSVHE